MSEKSLISLVFDDGFYKSCQAISRLYESYGLRADFAVLAEPSEFLPHIPKGDFNYWNELQSKGHFIHPHGWDHSDLTQIPFSEVEIKTQNCIHFFKQNLQGFQAENSIYFLTYNRSTSQIEDYLLSKFKCIRTTGDGLPSNGYNDSNNLIQKKFTSNWHGPEPCGPHLIECLKEIEKEKPMHFLYMLHGLDQEGWGPIQEEDLKFSLQYIINSPLLELSPISQAFESLSLQSL